MRNFHLLVLALHISLHMAVNLRRRIQTQHKSEIKLVEHPVLVFASRYTCASLMIYYIIDLRHEVLQLVLDAAMT